MSVINQMLQDLESRRSGLETETAAPTPIRSAGVVQERHSPLLVFAVGIAIVLGALLAWLLLKPKSAQPPAPAAIVAITPAKPVASAPQPIQAPVATPAAVASAPAVAAPVPAPYVAAQPSTATSRSLPATLALESTAAGRPNEQAVPVAKSEINKPAAVPTEPAGPPSINQAIASPPPPLSKAAQRARDKSAIAALEGEPQNFKNRTPQQRIDERYREALRKLNEGRGSQARLDLAEVLQTQPEHSGARLALVGLELDDKQAPQAERLLREGIQLQPQESTFTMALARLEVERGDPAAGLATLNRGLQSAGDDPEYHAFMAALLQRADRHSEAIEHYQIALRQREAANWLVGLAISLEGANRAREAEQIYRRAQQSHALPPDLQEFVAQRLQQLKS